MIRSNTISLNKITQIVNILISYLSEKLLQIEPKLVNEKLHLKSIFFENERSLHILQTILTTIAFYPNLKFKLQK